MFPWLLLAATALLVGSALVYLMGALRRWRREVRMRRARREFAFQREQLEAKFIDCAAATGKPRGLRWAECSWDAKPVFVRDRHADKLAAFVGVTIRFEPIPGEGMEDVPAARNLRTATGVFHYEDGRWITIGRALFNLEPQQAVARLKDQFEPVVPPAT